MSFTILKKYILTVTLIITITVMLIYTDTYKESVSSAILACGNVLIPSLFPFFFLSNFIVDTDCFSSITSHSKILCRALGIPKESIVAILLSMIGGFPVGARTVVSLYQANKINKEEAEKLFYCCVGAGPGFMVTFVGENLLLSKQAGILLLISNSFSVIFLILINRCKGIKNSKVNISKKEIYRSKTVGTAIVSSTENAVKSTFSMCGFVIIFIVINNFLIKIPYYNGYTASLLEITGGMINYGKNMPYEIIAFLIGFGGICVHFQVYGMNTNLSINKLYFVLMRMSQGFVSALIMHFLLIFFPITQETFGNITTTPKPSISGTTWGATAIVLLSVIFLISIKRKNNQEVNLCAE